MNFLHEHLGALGGGGAAAFGAGWLLFKDLIRDWWQERKEGRRIEREISAAQASSGSKLQEKLFSILMQDQADCKAMSERYFSILMAQGSQIEKIADSIRMLVLRSDQAHDDLTQIKGAVQRSQ